MQREIIWFLCAFLALLLAAGAAVVGCGDDDDDDVADDDDNDDNDNSVDDDDSGDDDDDDDDDLQWNITTVESEGDVGTYSSIAVDGNGHAHISYYDAGQTRLRFANNSSGDWVATTVDENNDVGMYTSLALDSSNGIHIAYHQADCGYALKYAHVGKALWVIETVEGDAGLYASLVVDSSGTAHVVHLNSDKSVVRYSENASGWNTSTLATAAAGWEFDGGTDLVLDGAGDLHALYHQHSTLTYQVIYTSYAKAGWTPQTAVSAESTEIAHASLALDSSGKAHVPYYFHEFGEYSSALKYATNASGSWNSEDVAWGEFVRYSTSTVVQGGSVHVGFYDLETSALKYATNGSGAWVTSPVDGEGDVGRDASLAIDSLGHLHISYYDVTEGDLKYATTALK